jgi:hypothetical protein
MKITKEIKERTDHKGNLIDFTMCMKCYHFIHFEDEPIGADIQCSYCDTDKYITFIDS